MTFAQKVSRVLLFTVALVAACILAAMVFALVIYILQQGTRIMRDYPHLLNGLVIIFAAITVNAACVAVLFQIRKFDRMLMESETK
jgi:TctA family transporter